MSEFFSNSVTADNIAASAGLYKSVVHAGDFNLTTYSRLRAKEAPLNVYIEGDGLAYLSRSRISYDPSPRNPVGLKLAAEDPAPNVVYIARPCQYDSRSEDALCKDFAYWTNKRFSEEVVVSIDRAIDIFLRRAHADKVNLIGYSGGGAIAVLVAARRNDVTSIRTVAGNLDHTALNRHHKTSQLDGSLNAIDIAQDVREIPQHHFSGGNDKIVPPFIAREFENETHNSGCVHVTELAEFSHADGWVEYWRELLKKPITCEV